MSSEAGYDEFDITKEQRGDRLWWVIWGVGAMLLVIGALYLNERGEIRLLHVFVLNLLVYGTLLYVDNLEDLKKPWLWKAVLFTIPIHIVCVVLLWLWDADVPNSGWAIMNRILTFFYSGIGCHGADSRPLQTCRLAGLTTSATSATLNLEESRRSRECAHVAG